MTNKIMFDPTYGCAVFSETGSSGAFDDPLAGRNAPLVDPDHNFANLVFHSSNDHFEVADAGSTTLTHASIAGITTPQGLNTPYAVDRGGDDQLLFTHNLGYPPFFLCVVGGNVLWPGMDIQLASSGDGGARCASPYVSNTELRLATIASVGASGLPSLSETYQFLIFAEPPAPANDVLYDFNPGNPSALVKMGFDKFSSDRRYLQVISGGTPFVIAFDETISLNNGAYKAWQPGGGTTAPVPVALKSCLIMLCYEHAEFTGSETFGASMAYGGSGAGPSQVISVQAP